MENKLMLIIFYITPVVTIGLAAWLSNSKRLSSSSNIYLMLNFIGGICALVVLMNNKNVLQMIVYSFWVFSSIYGISHCCFLRAHSIKNEIK